MFRYERWIRSMNCTIPWTCRGTPHQPGTPPPIYNTHMRRTPPCYTGNIPAQPHRMPMRPRFPGIALLRHPGTHIHTIQRVGPLRLDLGHTISMPGTRWPRHVHLPTSHRHWKTLPPCMRLGTFRAGAWYRWGLGTLVLYDLRSMWCRYTGPGQYTRTGWNHTPCHNNHMTLPCTPPPVFLMLMFPCSSQMRTLTKPHKPWFLP